MSKKVNLLDGFIKLTERFYVKPCEAAPDRFDLYEYKSSENKKRHPEGKMDDVVYGITLEKAAEMAANSEAGKVASDLRGMIEELQKVNQEIKKNVTEYIS